MQLMQLIVLFLIWILRPHRSVTVEISPPQRVRPCSAQPLVGADHIESEFLCILYFPLRRTFSWLSEPLPSPLSKNCRRKRDDRWPVTTFFIDYRGVAIRRTDPTTVRAYYRLHTSSTAQWHWRPRNQNLRLRCSDRLSPYHTLHAAWAATSQEIFTVTSRRLRQPRIQLRVGYDNESWCKVTSNTLRHKLRLVCFSKPSRFDPSKKIIQTSTPLVFWTETCKTSHPSSSVPNLIHDIRLRFLDAVFKPFLKLSLKLL